MRAVLLMRGEIKHKFANGYNLGKLQVNCKCM